MFRDQIEEDIADFDKDDIADFDEPDPSRMNDEPIDMAGYANKLLGGINNGN